MRKIKRLSAAFGSALVLSLLIGLLAPDYIPNGPFDLGLYFGSMFLACAFFVWMEK